MGRRAWRARAAWGLGDLWSQVGRSERYGGAPQTSFHISGGAREHALRRKTPCELPDWADSKTPVVHPRLRLAELDPGNRGTAAVPAASRRFLVPMLHDAAPWNAQRPALLPRASTPKRKLPESVCTESKRAADRLVGRTKHRTASAAGRRAMWRTTHSIDAAQAVHQPSNERFGLKPTAAMSLLLGLGTPFSHT